MRVFFNIKSSARERHWDTYKEAKKMFDVIDTDVKGESSVKIYKKSNSSFLSKVKLKIIENLNLVNYQKIPLKAGEADLLYVWGGIPKTEREYIIELDNPYVLTYYKPEAFYKKIDVLKKELKKAKKITFLSNAAKNHFLHYFKEFEEKCFVNYPFMERNYLKREKGDILNFIFVGMDFKRKGGAEVLEAFSRVADKGMRLTFVSDTPEYVIKKYQNQNICFLKPLKREELFEIYKKMDVFIMPTLHESFGVVFLEALSFGMGIIGTNVYATPEIIKHNFNGILLHHPFIKPVNYNGADIIDCTQKRIGEFNRSYRQSGEFYYSLYEELKEAILKAKESYKIWRQNSIELYEERFSEDVWRKNFERIVLK